MSTSRGKRSTPEPTIPVSCGAILLDERGRLLIVKPTYKSGWTIPGGSMRASGETPWQACQREVLEETAVTVSRGRLVVVDTRPHSDDRQLGMRFLFHCGTVAPDEQAGIRIRRGELSEYRFAPVAEALELLRPAISRRVAVGLVARSCVYLENGSRVHGVIS